MGNELFWSSFKIGLIWAFSVTTLQFLAAMGLALLLNENLKLRWLARTLSLVPWAMPPVVTGIMWRLMFDPNSGPISSTSQALGLGPLNLLGDFSTALPAVIVVGVWAGMPQTTITLLAGLQASTSPCTRPVRSTAPARGRGSATSRCPSSSPSSSRSRRSTSSGTSTPSTSST